MSWLNGSICCPTVMLLFPQNGRNVGLNPGWVRCSFCSDRVYSRFFSPNISRSLGLFLALSLFFKQLKWERKPGRPVPVVSNVGPTAVLSSSTTPPSGTLPGCTHAHLIRAHITGACTFTHTLTDADALTIRHSDTHIHTQITRTRTLTHAVTHADTLTYRHSATHIHTHKTRTCTLTHALTDAVTLTYRHGDTCMHSHTDMVTHTHTHTHRCTHRHIYGDAHTHTHTRTHRCMHTHIQTHAY